MKFLIVGDVVAKPGRAVLVESLARIQDEYARLSVPDHCPDQSLPQLHIVIPYPWRAQASRVTCAPFFAAPF